MGIFDDAIREHLELKRHAGAEEEELKELEDEAFGPPARPGEPDFPGSTSEEAAGEEAGASSAPFDAAAEEAATPADAVVEAPAGEEPALTPLDEAVGAGSDTPAAAPEGAEPEEPETPAETAGLSPADGESSFTTEEREAIADQPTVFFEQQAPAEMELGDLDLDLDEEIEEVGGAVEAPLTDEEPLIVEEAFGGEPDAEAEVADSPHDAEPAESPHEAEPSQDAEPEPTPPSAPERQPEPPSEPEAADPVTSDFVPPAEAGDQGTSEEDVLEETPEFLRDNPDDDELWFEQGEPKDFDF